MRLKRYLLETRPGCAVARPIRAAPTLVSVDGLTFLTPRRDRGRYRSGFETRTVSWLTATLLRGDRVVDVGAAIGAFSLIAARAVGSLGSVMALEPAPGNRRYIRANLYLNRTSNVEVLPVAAAGKAGITTFNITDSSDSHSFYDHPLISTHRQISVPTVTVDSLANEACLVKIDVEGAELDVLDGMPELLARRTPLLVELAPACQAAAGKRPRELVDFLLDAGYCITVLDETYGRELTAKDLIEELETGQLPLQWYANLVCTKGQQLGIPDSDLASLAPAWRPTDKLRRHDPVRTS